MNPSTLIGILGSLVLMVAVLFFAAADPWQYLDLPGLALVVGGTLAATFISYPLREVLRIFGLIGTVLRNERLYTEEDLNELVKMARLWIAGNLQAVERELMTVRNPFLRTGVQLVIDNTPEADIVDLLQWRIARLRAKEAAEAQLFRVMGGFAPAFGMLGTLVGLVNLMLVIGDGDMVRIGQQMGLALITTLYGVLLANLLFKPIAVKLERRTEERVVLMNMVLQGVRMMCERRSPTLMRETLRSFVVDFRDEIHDDAPPAAAGPGTPGDEVASGMDKGR